MARPRRASADSTPLKGARFLIVEGRFYDGINDQLIAGAKAAIRKAGAASELITVPGCLEIPAAIAIALDAAAAAGRPYDGVVALGCVIRGETTHYEIVSGESARALMDLSAARKLALGNGILTVENEAQARERASPRRLNKGGGAAEAALALARLKRKLGVSP